MSGGVELPRQRLAFLELVILRWKEWQTVLSYVIEYIAVNNIIRARWRWSGVLSPSIKDQVQPSVFCSGTQG
jgi:hypothetical protein